MTSPPARKRLWRKRLTRAICLLLGAVTTVGVAWALAEVGFRGTVAQSSASGASQRVAAHVNSGMVTDLVMIVVSTGDAFDQVSSSASGEASPELAATSAAMLPVDDLHDLPLIAALPEWVAAPPLPKAAPAPGTTEGSSAITDCRGWPMRALTRRQYEEYRWVGKRKQTISSRDVGSVKVGLRFPAQPILPGFLLDTLFYAAPWWLILITPGAVKRRRRRGRGRCIHCGYDLAGLPADDNATPTCPECGA